MQTTSVVRSILLSTLCAGMLSCNKDHVGSGEKTIHDPYQSPSVPQGQITIVMNPIRERPYLGSGYNIMGNYLESTSVKKQILDLTKFEPDEISSLAFRQSCSKSYEGRDAKHLLQSIMTKNEFELTGENAGDLLFTGTLTESIHFNSPYDYSEQYSFICHQRDYTDIRQQILVVSTEQLANSLTDAFLEDIHLLTPQEIIETYGTHVICTSYLGARVRNLYRSVVVGSQEEQLTIASYGAEARRRELYAIPGDQQELSQEKVAQNYGGTIQLEFNGGDSSVLPRPFLLPNALIGDPMDISAWWASVQPSNYSLTTLSGKDLVPLYELIQEPTIREQLKAATVAYIKSRQPEFLKNHPLLQARNQSSYRYYTSYADFEANAAAGYQLEGVIGSLFAHPQPETAALYLYANEQTDYLSFDPDLAQALQMELKGTIGHCYTKWSSERDVLYEITNGTQYAYTLESREKYGENGTWKPTGKEFFVPKVSL